MGEDIAGLVHKTQDVHPVYLIIALIAMVAVIYRSDNPKVEAPVIGKRWRWEPALITRLRFMVRSHEIIKEGYAKHKDRAFIVRRLDTDIVVLSNKYVEELKSVPLSTLHSMKTLSRTMGGKYTGFEVSLNSNIHTRALQYGILPRLSKLQEPLREELDIALRRNITVQDEWEASAVDFNELIRAITISLSARALVGRSLSRNAEWQSTGHTFTENAFKVAYFIRIIPWMLSPLTWLLLRLNPSWHAIQRDFATGRRLIRPLVEKARGDKDAGKEDEEDVPTALQWMSLNGQTQDEMDPAMIARRNVLLGTAAHFTTAHATSFFFYEMCNHPQYIEELRAEAEECLLESGCWDRPTLDKMRKIESFMSESQRLNPNMMIVFNREVMKPITLSDGLHLPKGTYIGMPAEEILNDPAVTPDPQRFDPWRSFHARQRPGEEMKHRFAMSTANSLHFGHGMQACSGRQLALVIEKMIAVAILIAWDIRFPEGKGHPRPERIAVDDFMFPKPGVRIEMRRRPVRPGVPAIGI